jgi:hypothetical protein
MLSSQDQVQERLAICDACSYLRPIVKQCAKCGCFVLGKAQFEAAKCPEGKW